jgi:hypothetical protein
LRLSNRHGGVGGLWNPNGLFFQAQFFSILNTASFSLGSPENGRNANKAVFDGNSV